MNRLITALALASVPFAAVAGEQVLTLGNGLNFSPSFQQSIAEVQTSADRIRIIPSVSNDRSGIAYLVTCAEVSIPKDKFAKLAQISFSSGSKIPSAGLSSHYGGVTTIGSDNVTITAGFPDVLKKGHRYEASVIADITTVDPNRRSSTGLSINMKTDGEDSTNEDVSQTVVAGPYHYLTVSLMMRDQEGFELVRKIPARLEASMLSQMASQEIPEDQRFENEAILSEVQASGSMLFSAADTGSIVDEDGHVEVCWKPNNYESITREGAELIDPKLTLRYND